MPTKQIWKVSNGLVPNCHESQCYYEKLKQGDLVEVKVVKSRNLQWHKKFFALLHLGHDNQEHYTTFDDYEFAMKLATGWCSKVVRSDGEILYNPKSYSFNSMNQDEFEAIYDETINITLRVMPMAREDLEREIIAFG